MFILAGFILLAGLIKPTHIKPAAPATDIAQPATPAAPGPQSQDLAALKNSVNELIDDVKSLKNDPSKYWLLLIGGGLGVAGSVMSSFVAGRLAMQNKNRELLEIARQKDLELVALSQSKTKELLFNQIAGFSGKAQPRASVLASISAFHLAFPDLRSLFRVFLVSQLEYLISQGDNLTLEQSNAFKMLQLGLAIGLDAQDRQTIKAAWTANPNGSNRQLQMSAQAVAILKTF